MFLFALISFILHPVAYVRDMRYSRRNFDMQSRFNGGDGLFGPNGYPDDSLYPKNK